MSLPLLAALSAAVIFIFDASVYASSGTEGASFLDIPVGAEPAALGGAYSAEAADAYAPTWNPGGLGFVDNTQLAGQHLSYLESIHYEYLSFVHPLREGSSIGGSVQYLGSGDIQATDISGNNIGTFSSYYAAYNLSYGRALNSRLSLGVTGKWINAAIDDVTANAFAADFGSMYRLRNDLTLAAVLTNVGSQLKFLEEGDSLPMAFHLGAAYRPFPKWNFAVEGVFPKTGLVSGHLGIEWKPVSAISLLTGYRTDTLNGLSALAGYSVGVGLHVWGQEFAYAWLPYGELGNTNYISMIIRFGNKHPASRDLIQYHAHRPENTGTEEDQDHRLLMQLLDNSSDKTAANPEVQPLKTQ